MTRFVTAPVMIPGLCPGLMQGDKCLQWEQWTVCRPPVVIFPVSLQHGPLASGRSLACLPAVVRVLLPPCQYEPIRPHVNTEDSQVPMGVLHHMSGKYRMDLLLWGKIIAYLNDSSLIDTFPSTLCVSFAIHSKLSHFVL